MQTKLPSYCVKEPAQAAQLTSSKGRKGQGGGRGSADWNAGQGQKIVEHKSTQVLQ